MKLVLAVLVVLSLSACSKPETRRTPHVAVGIGAKLKATPVRGKAGSLTVRAGEGT